MKELSKIVGKPTDEISEKIVKLFEELDPYFCKVNCGMFVDEVRQFAPKVYEVNVLAMKSLGRNSPKIRELFPKLMFFDAADDCPQCGRELHEHDGDWFCTNCGYDTEPAHPFENLPFA